MTSICDADGRNCSPASSANTGLQASEIKNQTQQLLTDLQAKEKALTTLQKFGNIEGEEIFPIEKEAELRKTQETISAGRDFLTEIGKFEQSSLLLNPEPISQWKGTIEQTEKNWSRLLNPGSLVDQKPELEGGIPEGFSGRSVGTETFFSGEKFDSKAFQSFLPISDTLKPIDSPCTNALCNTWNVMKTSVGNFLFNPDGAKTSTVFEGQMSFYCPKKHCPNISDYNPGLTSNFKGGTGKTSTGTEYCGSCWEIALRTDLARNTKCGYGYGKVCYALLEQCPAGGACKKAIVKITDNGPLGVPGRIIDANGRVSTYFNGGVAGNTDGVKLTILSGSDHALGPVDQISAQYAQAKQIPVPQQRPTLVASNIQTPQNGAVTAAPTPDYSAYATGYKQYADTRTRTYDKTILAAAQVETQGEGRLTRSLLGGTQTQDLAAQTIPRNTSRLIEFEPVGTPKQITSQQDVSALTQGYEEYARTRTEAARITQAAQYDDSLLAATQVETPEEVQEPWWKHAWEGSKSVAGNAYDRWAEWTQTPAQEEVALEDPRTHGIVAQQAESAPLPRGIGDERTIVITQPEYPDFFRRFPPQESAIVAEVAEKTGKTRSLLEGFEPAPPQEFPPGLPYGAPPLPKKVEYPELLRSYPPQEKKVPVAQITPQHDVSALLKRYEDEKYRSVGEETEEARIKKALEYDDWLIAATKVEKPKIVAERKEQQIAAERERVPDERTQTGIPEQQPDRQTVPWGYCFESYYPLKLVPCNTLQQPPAQKIPQQQKQQTLQTCSFFNSLFGNCPQKAPVTPNQEQTPQQIPTSYGSGSGSAPCPAPSPRPTDSSCNGTLQPQQSSNGCLIGWQCIPDTSPLSAELSCAPKLADKNQTISISFACRGAESAKGEGFDTKSKLLGISTTTIRIQSGTTTPSSVTYTLRCADKAGVTVSKQCIVNINSSFIVLVANPRSVTLGEAAGIGWVTAGIDSCTLSSAQLPTFTEEHKDRATTAGVVKTPPLTEDTVFDLSCITKAGSKKTASTTVELIR